VRIGNGAIGEFLWVVHKKHALVYYDLPVFSNFSFLKNLLHRLVLTRLMTAHCGTNDFEFELIVGSADRKRSPSVNVSEKCKRRKLNQSGDFRVCQSFATAKKLLLKNQIELEAASPL